MYDIRKLFERKPDHPMTSAADARRLCLEDSGGALTPGGD